jgi:hypothetical protein
MAAVAASRIARCSRSQRPIQKKTATPLSSGASLEQTSDFGVCEIAAKPREEIVNGLIYLIGLIVVILFILSFLGLR